MSFDIEATIKSMLEAMKGVVGDNWKDVGSYAGQILQNKKEVFRQLVEEKLRGDITEDEFASELEDEKDTFEAELDALNVLKKAMIQKAVNAALDVLYKAIKMAL